MNLFTAKQKHEVDLRVAQELKNNQDFIYQTGQHLDVLRSGIASLSIQNEKVRTDTISETKRILIEFENLGEALEKRMHDVEQKISCISKEMTDFLKSFTQLMDDITKTYLPREEFHEIFDPVDECLCNVIGEQERGFAYLNNALKQSEKRLLDNIIQVKEEIKPIPPEIKREDMEEKFMTWKINFDGLVTEIAILKKAVAYDQKKFENLYTLIERLKEDECRKKAQ